MIENFASEQAWLAPGLFLAILSAIVVSMWLRWPRALWRRFSTVAVRTPQPLVALASVVAFIALNATIYHLEGVIAGTTQGQPREGLEWPWVYSFGFLWKGWSAEGGAWPHFVAFLGLGLIFAISATILYQLRYSIFNLDIEEKEKAQKAPFRRRVIIMGLSHLGGDQSTVTAAIKEFSQLPLNEAVNLTYMPQFPWQQNLRVLYYHLHAPNPDAKSWIPLRRSRGAPEAQHVFILPSEQSAEQATLFRDMAKKCLANSNSMEKLKFEVCSPVNYSSFNELKEAFQDIMARAVGDKNISAEDYDISIDTTSGKKVPSIAAAAATFANRAEFTYVDSDDQTWWVAPFDVIARFRAPSNP